MSNKGNVKLAPGLAVLIIGGVILLLPLILEKDQSPKPADPNEIPAEVMKAAKGLGETKLYEYYSDSSFEIIRVNNNLSAPYKSNYVIWSTGSKNLLFTVQIITPDKLGVCPADSVNWNLIAIGERVKLFSLGDPIQKFRPGQSVIVFAVPESETERFKKLTRK